VEPTRSALLDTSVWRIGLTTRVEYIPSTPNRNGRILGIRRIPPRSKEPWRQQQIEALPTITRLAREGRVKLCHCAELIEESWGGDYLGAGGFVGDLFNGVPLHDVPEAVVRSHFQQLDFAEYVKKEKVIQFCRDVLLGCSYDMFEKRPQFLSRFTDFERENLKRLDRFKQLCSALPENHYPDALHLWTAEVNGLDYFLTADKTFINVMTKTSRVPLPTRPISPSDLLTELGVTQLDPLPILDDELHPLA
jgi:hypothetical protein